jgi:ribonuclease HI
MIVQTMLSEYEDFLIGLNLALDRNIRCLKVIGDSDLIVSQVNLKFSMKNERLRRYRDSVRDTIKFLMTFQLKSFLEKKTMSLMP